MVLNEAVAAGRLLSSGTLRVVSDNMKTDAGSFSERWHLQPFAQLLMPGDCDLDSQFRENLKYRKTCLFRKPDTPTKSAG